MNDRQKKIHQKISQLVTRPGGDAATLGLRDSIPASGLLDSPALLELIVWYEIEFGLDIDPDELTIENFGTIEAMADYATKAGR